MDLVREHWLEPANKDVDMTTVNTSSQSPLNFGSSWANQIIFGSEQAIDLRLAWGDPTTSKYALNGLEDNFKEGANGKDSAQLGVGQGTLMRLVGLKSIAVGVDEGRSSSQRDLE